MKKKHTGGAIQIAAISCGVSHSAAVDSEGQVYMFGSNDLMQMGLRDRTCFKYPKLLRNPKEKAT